MIKMSKIPKRVRKKKILLNLCWELIFIKEVKAFNKKLSYRRKKSKN